jgi:6-phosphogluconolactonase
MTPAKVEVFQNPTDLIQKAGDLFVSAAQEAVAENGRFLTALSGGSTPQALFQLLATPAYASQIEWQHTHILWGDERLVPPDDPGSNYKLALDSLLNHVSIPAENIHRAKGELDVETAVIDYTQQIRKLALPGQSFPQLDLALMGLGSDGHTASLFPGPIPAYESILPVMAVTANYDGRPAQRITLTPLIFNAARHLLFLATGTKKAAALAAVLNRQDTPEMWPAQRIQPTSGTITWLVDEDATQKLKQDNL